MLARVLRLIAMVIWVGGIIFFAFVLAPVAFSRLPSQHIAGIVVGGTLRVLDVVGFVCGAVFWVATAILFRQSPPKAKRRFEIQLVLAAIMLFATAYLHAGVLPSMEQERIAAGGDIEAAPLSSSAKVHFESLHKRSERLEGIVLFMGLGTVVLMAGETHDNKEVNL